LVATIVANVRYPEVLGAWPVIGLAVGRRLAGGAVAATRLGRTTGNRMSLNQTR
jgi:hypothetical protein